MIYVDTAYVSPLLEETLKKKDVTVFDTVQQLYLRKAKQTNNTYPILNAETAFESFVGHNENNAITKLAQLFKNKIAFREHLAKHHPQFFYQKMTKEELLTNHYESLPYPLIIKPAVGYSSVGVFLIEQADQYVQIVKQMLEAVSGTDGEQLFLLESYIQGQEFAIDMYYNGDLEPVILNIFSRVFKNEHDMSDRVYYTSKKLVSTYLTPITTYLVELQKTFSIEPMPLHIELRIDASGHIMPIEINPLRFAGEGTTELGYFAYGVNPYDYFFEQKKPDWPALLTKMDDQIYNFTCAVLESNLNTDAQINHEKIKTKFHQVLEYRHLPYTDGATFAVIFYTCAHLSDLDEILHMHFDDFVEQQIAVK